MKKSFITLVAGAACLGLSVFTAEAATGSSATATITGPDSLTTQSLATKWSLSATVRNDGAYHKSYTVEGYILDANVEKRRLSNSVFGVDPSSEKNVAEAVEVLATDLTTGKAGLPAGNYAVVAEVYEGQGSSWQRTLLTRAAKALVVTEAAGISEVSAVTSDLAAVSIAGPESFTSQDSFPRWNAKAIFRNVSSFQRAYTTKGYILSASGEALHGGGGYTTALAKNSSGEGDFDIVLTESLDGLASGKYTVVAEAYDGQSAFTSLLARAVKTVTFANAAPVPSIYSPLGGQSFDPGSQIEVISMSSGNEGFAGTSSFVNKIELYDNGVKVAEAAKTGAVRPNLSFVPASDGNHVLVVKNVTVSGAVSASGPVTVTVGSRTNGNPVAAPVLQVSPSGTVAPGTAVTATVTTPVAYASVELYANGKRVGELNGGTSPYRFTWTPAAEGTYVLSAKTYSTITTSNGVTVRVAAAAGASVQNQQAAAAVSTPNAVTPAQSQQTASVAALNAVTPVQNQQAAAVAAPEAPAAIPACPATLASDGSPAGTVRTCSCASWSQANVWGSNPYSDGSNLCAAARHAGAAIPGNITYTIAAPRSSYSGTAKNGVTSKNYGSWEGKSFTIFAPAAAGANSTTAASVTVPAAASPAAADVAASAVRSSSISAGSPSCAGDGDGFMGLSWSFTDLNWYYGSPRSKAGGGIGGPESSCTRTTDYYTTAYTVVGEGITFNLGGSVRKGGVDGIPEGTKVKSVKITYNDGTSNVEVPAAIDESVWHTSSWKARFTVTPTTLGSHKIFVEFTDTRGVTMSQELNAYANSATPAISASGSAKVWDSPFNRGQGPKGLTSVPLANTVALDNAFSADKGLLEGPLSWTVNASDGRFIENAVVAVRKKDGTVVAAQSYAPRTVRFNTTFSWGTGGAGYGFSGSHAIYSGDYELVVSIRNNPGSVTTKSFPFTVTKKPSKPVLTKFSATCDVLGWSAKTNSPYTPDYVNDITQNGYASCHEDKDVKFEVAASSDMKIRSQRMLVRTKGSDASDHEISASSPVGAQTAALSAVANLSAMAKGNSSLSGDAIYELTLDDGSADGLKYVFSKTLTASGIPDAAKDPSVFHGSIGVADLRNEDRTVLANYASGDVVLAVFSAAAPTGKKIASFAIGLSGTSDFVLDNRTNLTDAYIADLSLGTTTYLYLTRFKESLQSQYSSASAVSRTVYLDVTYADGTRAPRVTGPAVTVSPNAVFMTGGPSNGKKYALGESMSTVDCTANDLGKDVVAVRFGVLEGNSGNGPAWQTVAAPRKGAFMRNNDFKIEQTPEKFSGGAGEYTVICEVKYADQTTARDARKVTITGSAATATAATTTTIPGVAPLAGAAAGPQQACPTTLFSKRGSSVTTGTCYCASAGTLSVWGSNPYSDDSSLCAAAQHAGVKLPGTVTYALSAGEASYSASFRNGITSSAWAKGWGGSFVISGADVAPVAVRAAPAANPALALNPSIGSATEFVGPVQSPAVEIAQPAACLSGTVRIGTACVADAIAMTFRADKTSVPLGGTLNVTLGLQLPAASSKTLKQHRFTIQGSSNSATANKRWTSLEASPTKSVSLLVPVTVSYNPASFFLTGATAPGAGDYTLIYEAEDSEGNVVSDSIDVKVTVN